MKRIIGALLALTMLFVLAVGNGAEASAHLERNDWSDHVKQAVNDFVDLYGKESDRYNPNSYVVSDFDNTASIFDMCCQFVVYQAEVMGYGFTPEELPAILQSGLGTLDDDLSRFGYGNGSYLDWIGDISDAYSYLYRTYGPFCPAGLDEEHALTVQADPMWAEFAAKLMNLYCLVEDNESTDVAYPWICYWLTGMTEDEVYRLAMASHAKYRAVNTAEKTISSPGTIPSRVGTTAYTYIEGVQVTENTVELWKVLNEAGFDIWVCTASEGDIIRAAVDEFGLHDYCTGLIGMTNTITNGKLDCTYDYDTGRCWYAEANGEWRKGDAIIGAQTQGIGKVISVQNVCCKEYGCGPLAGFMDSTGDYNFCTEFDSLKLVICFNRADRKVTDGGSVIAELAVYQRNELGYTLEKANTAGDTLYVLQGRDENGLRTLRNSEKTIRLGETEERLFWDEQNAAVYEYMKANQMTTGEIINRFAIRTDETAADNPVGFRYGFLSEYAGYHTK